MAIKPRRNIDLQPFNTLGLVSTADYFFELSDEQQIVDAWQYAQQKSLKITVIGEGSNLVLINARQSSLVLHNALKGIEEVFRGKDDVLVRVAAGENWHQWLLYAVSQGWHGIENLALIPGTAGAAPVQNIGAYGVELSSVVESVRAFDTLLQDFVDLPAAECGFEYRNSVFRANSRYIISSVTFRLALQFEPQLAYAPLAAVFAGKKSIAAMDVVNAVCDIRNSKLPDPAELPNAGSFFKNPLVSVDEFQRLAELYPDIPHYPEGDKVKLAAGWLVEKAGLKGERFGNLGMYQHQALVLVNYGETNGEVVLQFAAQVKEAVFNRFGVTLEIEPVLL